MRPVGNKLILASASPRRQELLRATGMEFETYPAHISEMRHAGEPALQYALRMAREKAEATARRFEGHCSFVLGADTIVIVDGEVLGKPTNVEDAARMLRLLSGRTHQVVTAVSLIAPQRPADTRSCSTNVCFKKLEEREIQAYISTGEPMDKAGAYAIQGGAAAWVTRLEGDRSNVIGLPMPLVEEMLRGAGF